MFITEFWSVFGSDWCSTCNSNSKSKSKYSSFYLEEDAWLFLPFVDHFDPFSTAASFPSLGPNWSQRWFALLFHVEWRGQYFDRYQQTNSSVWLFSAFYYLDCLLQTHPCEYQKKYHRKRMPSDQDLVHCHWKFCFCLHSWIYCLHVQQIAWRKCRAWVTCSCVPFGLVTCLHQSHHLHLLQWFLSWGILQSIEDQRRLLQLGSNYQWPFTFSFSNFEEGFNNNNGLIGLIKHGFYFILFDGNFANDLNINHLK